MGEMTLVPHHYQAVAPQTSQLLMKRHTRHAKSSPKRAAGHLAVFQQEKNLQTQWFRSVRNSAAAGPAQARPLNMIGIVLATSWKAALSPCGLAAIQPDAALLVLFEGAVDDGDRSHSIDSELSHQQSLQTAVDAECLIHTAWNSRW